MSGLQELRGIVRTMKSLSAASIRKFEQAVESLADYYRTVELGLQSITPKETPPPSARPKRGVHAAIVFGSEHGLCGAFNEDVVQRLSHEFVAEREYRLLAIGARLVAPLEDAGLRPDAMIEAPSSADRISQTVREQLLILDRWRAQRGLASLALCYNHHTRRGAYRAVYVPVLPVDLLRLKRRGGRSWPSRGIPMHTLTPMRLRAALTSQYVFVCAFRACAESQASEHGARLLAMQEAEKNLDHKIEELGAQYRRVRQATITAELLDVVAGYEALTRADADGSDKRPSV